MTQSDEGKIEALLKRLPSRIERAQGLKKRVDAGETLGDGDIEFLERVFRNSREVAPLIERHPEYQALAAQVIDLYHHITTVALDNEKARSD